MTARPAKTGITVVKMGITDEELKDACGADGATWNLALYRQASGSIFHPTSTTPDQAKECDQALREGLKAIAPKDGIEGMVAAQMIAAHNAAMESYRRAALTNQTFEGRQEGLNQANKLSRTYVTLVEALNRHRGKCQQKVTVEHVHVHEGGQAIVGNVSHPGVGGGTKSEDQPHALGYAAGAEMPREIKAEREALPGTSGQGS